MPTGSIIGFDLGGTKSAIARFDAATLTLQEHKKLPTHADRGWGHVLEEVVTLIKELQTDDTIGIGIGVPGLVRQPEGEVINMPNIPGAKNIPLKKQLEQQLSIPVETDNDANCFVLGEAHKGIGQGHNVVIGITMGTGVGGGIVINGELFHGSQGFAAEIGHMLLVPGQVPYNTDDERGEVEQFLSGTAFAQRCIAAQSPEDYLEGQVCSFLQPHVFREVAWLCVSLSHLLDPSIIIFGGSAGRALTPHLEKIKHDMTQWMLPGTPLPELATSTVDNAALVGAALLTQSKHEF